MTLWDSIKKIYKVNFNISENIIEYYSVLDVLKKCVSGYSNLRISFGLKDNIKYIRELLYEFIGFSGWDYDLDFSPIAVYNRCDNNYERYRQDVIMVSSVTSDSIIELSFLLCKKYKEIERIIDKHVI